MLSHKLFQPAHILLFLHFQLLPESLELLVLFGIGDGLVKPPDSIEPLAQFMDKIMS